MVEGYDHEGEAGNAQAHRSGKPAKAEGVEGKEEGCMNYLVYIWKSKDGKSETDFRECDDLDDANEYADFKASQLRKYGYEFDVRVYKLIS